MTVNAMRAADDMPRDGRETPRVDRELDYMNQEITRLDEAVAELIRRLEPALNPESRPEPDPGGVDKPVASEIARILIDQRNRVQNMTHTVVNVLERLEV